MLPARHEADWQLARPPAIASMDALPIRTASLKNTLASSQTTMFDNQSWVQFSCGRQAILEMWQVS